MEFDATFLISIISFIVFVFIMNTIFYSPIINIIEKRNRLVENNFSEAEHINSQANKQENYHKEKLETSRTEAKTTFDNKIQQLKTEKSKVISDYKSEMFLNISKEKENLRNSAIETKEVLKENVVDIAKNISNILLGSDINDSAINKSMIHIREEQV